MHTRGRSFSSRDGKSQKEEENKIEKAYQKTTGEKYDVDEHTKMQDDMTKRLENLGFAGGKTRRRSSARKQNKSKKHHKKSKKHRKKHHNKKSKKHRKK